MIQEGLVSIIKLALRSGIRGRTRLTMALGGIFPSLQRYPIITETGRRLYLDLRLVGTHDLLIGRSVEKAEQLVMSQFVAPGMSVYDIGANIGVHTVLLSGLVGSTGNVFAFEPQQHLLPALEKTVAELGNARLFDSALSDQNGTVSFFVAREASMSSLSNWTGDGTRVEVETRRLDDLVIQESLPLPDFIKCDIEGAELLCFRGGERTIDTARPLIMFEANLNASKSYDTEPLDVIRFLENLPNPKYHFFEIMEDGALAEVSDPAKTFGVYNDFSNILAVPENSDAMATLVAELEH